MINEWEEFCAYTGTVSYTASKKSDTTWLGRFTFATILEFEGMSRILTVLARRYLFHGKDGAVISGDPHDRVDPCALRLVQCARGRKACAGQGVAVPDGFFGIAHRVS